MFDHTVSENTASVLRQACLEHGAPHHALTGRGSRFCATESGAKRGKGCTRFEGRLGGGGVK